jgi:hypothetical protein
MTKIWLQSPDSDQYTETLNLDLKDHAEAYLGVKPCGAMTGIFFSNTRLEILSDHPPTDFFEPGAMFTVSDRLKVELEGFGVHAEFFPLRIICDGRDYTERAFYFCNILDCVECFDFDRGKCTFWKKPGFTDRIKKIKKLAIDEKKAEGHDLFRVAKGGEYIVCTSDRVAARIEELKLTGMRFIEPKDWQFGN